MKQQQKEQGRTDEWIICPIFIVRFVCSTSFKMAFKAESSFKE